MKINSNLIEISATILLALALAACSQAATPTPTATDLPTATQQPTATTTARPAATATATKQGWEIPLKFFEPLYLLVREEDPGVNLTTAVCADYAQEICVVDADFCPSKDCLSSLIILPVFGLSDEGLAQAPAETILGEKYVFLLWDGRLYLAQGNFALSEDDAAIYHCMVQDGIPRNSILQPLGNIPIEDEIFDYLRSLRVLEDFSTKLDYDSCKAQEE